MPGLGSHELGAGDEGGQPRRVGGLDQLDAQVGGRRRVASVGRSSSHAPRSRGVAAPAADGGADHRARPDDDGARRRHGHSRMPKLRKSA